MLKEKKKYCACGCGEEIPYYKVYAVGHCWNDPVYRKHLSDVRRGRKVHTKANKKRVSEWSKALWQNPEHRKKMETFNRRGWKHTKESRKKMSASRLRRKEELGYINSPEACRKVGEKSKKLWQDPKFREKNIKATLKALTTLPNKPEKKLRKILNRLFPGEYKYVGDGQVLIGWKNPDFININGQKKLIELFGDYWHGKKRTGLSKKEHRIQRQKHFAKYGHACCVVWEHELKNISKLEEKLVCFHNE